MKFCARRNLLEEMSERENSKDPEESRRSIGLKFMSILNKGEGRESLSESILDLQWSPKESLPRSLDSPWATVTHKRLVSSRNMSVLVFMQDIVIVWYQAIELVASMWTGCYFQMNCMSLMFPAVRDLRSIFLMFTVVSLHILLMLYSICGG